MISTLLPKAQVSPARRITAVRPTAVSVRRAKEADARAIANIYRPAFSAAHQEAFFASDLARYLADSFSLRQVMAEMRDVRTLFLVAEQKDKVVGAVRLKQAPPPGSVQLSAPVELSRLYLHPQHIGRGIGSTLMLHTLSTAVASGRQSCWLIVWERNNRAINFYRRWGFQPAGKAVLQVGQSGPSGLVMTRSL